jgi:hypothetical protein
LEKASERNLEKLYVFKIDDEGNISLEGRWKIRWRFLFLI